MRCAANANDAPIALEPGLIFISFFLCFLAQSVDSFGFVLALRSIRKFSHRSGGVFRAKRASRLINKTTAMRSDPIPADI